MKRQGLFALLLAGLMIPAALTSCGKDEDRPPVSTEAITAAPDNGDPDEPDVNVEEYALLLDSKFTGVPVCGESAFSFRETEAGAVITAYRGEDTAVRVPERIAGLNVVAVADGVFADRTDITTLILPASVTSIGKGIAEGCTSLSALETPLLGADAAAPQYLGYLFGATGYRDNAVKVPVSLKFLSFGGGMEKIDDYALFGCNDLTCVRLASTVKSIGKYAFYDCSRMLYVNLDAVTEFADHALDSCSSLTEIRLGSGVTSIGLGVFGDCSSLRRITLPFPGGSASENQYLGYLFGAEVPDHNEHYIPKNLRTVTLLEGCKSLGNNAFYQCTGIRTVNLPQGLTAVGIRAFSGCSSLTSVTLPEGLISIGDNAFFGCTALSSVTLPEGLTSIGINAFYQCVSLTDVILPRSLSSVPASCFANCISLSSVDLGGASTVGKNAFYRCVSLTSAKASAEVTMDVGNDSLKTLLEPN